MTSDSELRMDSLSPSEKMIASCVEDIVGYVIDTGDLDKRFLAIGIDSFNGVRFINALKTKGFQCPMTAISTITVRHLAARIDVGIYKGESESNLTLRSVDKLQPALPLSHRQERMYFLQNYDGTGEVYMYNEQMAIKLKGKLNYKLFGHALMTIVQEQTMLRTKFTDDGGQIVLSATENYFCMKPNREKWSEEKMLALRRQPFDLSERSPQRLAVFETDKDTTWFVLTQHHIITDGMSMTLIIKKLSSYYNQLVETGELTPSKLPFHYVDYAAWENEQLKSAAVAKQVKRWGNMLNLKQTKAKLTMVKSPNTTTQDALSENFKIDRHLVEFLTKASESTVFTVLLSTFVRTMFKLCKQNSLFFAVPFADRKLPETEDLVGMFVGTCLFPFEKDNLELTNLIKYVKQLVSEITDQSLVFEKVLKQDQFNVMFALHTGINFNFQIEGVKSSYLQRECVAKCDWLMWIDSEYSCSLIYRKGMFYSETVHMFINMYLEEISGAVQSFTKSAIDFPAVDTQTEIQMVQSLKVVEDEYPMEFTFPEAFANQAKRTSMNIAYECDRRKVSYNQLYIMAQNSAGMVKEKLQNVYGIKTLADNVCVVKSDHNPNILLDILTCHFAGLAYMPIDSKYPAKRVEFICHDSKVVLLLGEDDRVPADVPQFCHGKENYLKTPEMEHLDAGPEDLAYVMYTSGTTGNPKGVPVAHGRLGALIRAATSTLHLSDHSCLLQLYSFTFDSSWTDLSVLANGGSIMLNTEPTELIETLKQNPHINGLSVTPALLSNIDQDELEKLKQLEFLCYIGETMQHKTLDDLLQLGCNVIQGYGPTEAIVVVAFKKMKIGDKSANIGKARAGCSMNIVSQANTLCPVETIGELCITGDCLARGYLNLPEQTKKSFDKALWQNNGSSIKTGNQLQYRTGDLAKLEIDGNITFLGRMDSQVKIRGYRVELEEIETVLNLCDAVKTSVVQLAIIPKSKMSVLVAYYVLKCERSDIQKCLTTHLKMSLADYMIPKFFVPIKVLPLTVNGKLDKTALKESFADFLASKNMLKR